jgi:hypothetical protein
MPGLNSSTPTAKPANTPFMTEIPALHGPASPALTQEPDISSVIGYIPYRMALAGGWIDQPFVSCLNPTPPGSMVVVSLQPSFPFMNRCGMATSTRKIAARLWNGRLPRRSPAELVRELYTTENANRAEPSGSQDMAGLIYPGISRLDYDFAFEGGYFPVRVESNNYPQVAGWLERVVQVVAVAPRPDGYNPLGIKNLDAEWARRLGQSGKDCFNAILAQDMKALGASLNESMLCWEALLPHTVRHPILTADLKAILGYYQARYSGAMYSGCGGGYLFVVSEQDVPGAFRVKVRIQAEEYSLNSTDGYE